MDVSERRHPGGGPSSVSRCLYFGSCVLLSLEGGPPIVGLCLRLLDFLNFCFLIQRLLN